MPTQLDHDVAPATTIGPDDWDLDLSIVESGEVVEKLLRMTDDGCGQTCQSACNSCP